MGAVKREERAKERGVDRGVWVERMGAQRGLSRSGQRILPGPQMWLSVV